VSTDVTQETVEEEESDTEAVDDSSLAVDKSFVDELRMKHTQSDDEEEEYDEHGHPSMLLSIQCSCLGGEESRRLLNGLTAFLNCARAANARRVDIVSPVWLMPPPHGRNHAQSGGANGVVSTDCNTGRTSGFFWSEDGQVSSWLRVVENPSMFSSLMRNLLAISGGIELKGVVKANSTPDVQPKKRAPRPSLGTEVRAGPRSLDHVAGWLTSDGKIICT
jgi:hypothetical protein